MWWLGIWNLFPDAELADWSNEEQATHDINHATDLLGETLPARVAADWAECALPALKEWSPDDPVWEGWSPSQEPQEAIAATRAWADSPCVDFATLAEAAADSAELAADAAHSFDGVRLVRPMRAVTAANATWCVAYGNAAYAAWSAGYCTVEQSRADTVEAAWSCATWAALTADDPDAECDWQRLRLAAYVLGEVEAKQP
ncbi:MAG: hypothetical protein JKY65_25725 [Planctomycetes bacterium]|nr:hypothetical protein [Planctomycetota bacterium]